MTVSWSSNPKDWPSPEYMRKGRRAVDEMCALFNKWRNRMDGEFVWGCITSAIISDMATFMNHYPERAKEFQDAYIVKAKVLVEALEAHTPEQVEKMVKHGIGTKGMI